MIINKTSYVLIGVSFAILWSSASVATKWGLAASQPFVLAIARFALGGSVMLCVSHFMLKHRLPAKHEWKQLLIYGVLNIGIYLGLYVLAMQHVSAGLGSLFPAVSPVFVSVISALFYRQKTSITAVISLLLCLLGILVAAYPLLLKSYASPLGLFLLLLSMLSYSVGSIYFSRKNWQNLHVLTINGWQTVLGGLLLVPFMLVYYDSSLNHFNGTFFASVSWLAFIVSIGAVQMWLYLIKQDAVKASFWLFLCPIFGFLLAWILMDEPIDGYTIFGISSVIIGLYLVLKKR
ncbi:DMT family transporter [Olivibacter sp. XZL3]|uniref:DMT family transporter n=1 Tax=Olivibacter sp. XZL3 TaxID=1735116 RepID=UPI0010657C01|nr:DMT family transporter [Olivibacter sp. XZL3]